MRYLNKMAFLNVMIGNIINGVVNNIGYPCVPVAETEGNGAHVSANRFQIAVWARSVTVKCLSGGIIVLGCISSHCHCVSHTILGKFINHEEPHLTAVYEVGTIAVRNT